MYVSNGISLDITVDLLGKDKSPVSTYYVSLWDSNGMVAESNKIDASKTEYTFKSIASKSETVKYTLKITTNQKDYYAYSEFTMNFKTGRPTGSKVIYDYLEMETDDIQSSSSSTNSGSSSSSGSSGTTGTANR